jgi:hypothetical protein
MKQTAVEWLVSILNKEEFAQVVTDEEIQQAKEMEKEQIMTAFTQGELFSGDFYDPNNPKADCSENYYNETYGGKK